MKKLVICMDGTWNETEKTVTDLKDKSEPTNVLKVYRGVTPKDENGIAQVAYYHSGVGTDKGLYDRVVGGGIGVGISDDIKDAYRFVANNYEIDDKIFIFGFSRGAYAARALAGFIGAVGLLEKKYLQWTPEAYQIYRTEPTKRSRCPHMLLLHKVGVEAKRDVPIHFVGVWDTVGALGAPTPILKKITNKHIGYFDTDLGKDVKHAYHALAIDDRRKPFKPDLWTSKGDPDQIIEQVWFAGVHSNIGGSYKNTELSDIALRWMIDRASECGLRFMPFLWGLAEGTVKNGRIENSFSFLYSFMRLLGVPPYDREIGPNQTSKNRKKIGVNEWAHHTANEASVKSYEIDARKKSKDDTNLDPYSPTNLKKAIVDGLKKWGASQTGTAWKYSTKVAVRKY